MANVVQCKDGDLQIPEKMMAICAINGTDGKVNQFLHDHSCIKWCKEHGMGEVFNKLQEMMF